MVDDDEGVRTALAELLGSMGFDALTFGSAEAFLDAPRAHLHCLVADVHLPGMSGPALVRRLAAEGLMPAAVLVTAHDDPATLELIRQTGPVPHLHKPFSDAQLADAIRRATAS